MISREGAKARRREDFKKETFHPSFSSRPRLKTLPEEFSLRPLFSLSFLRAFAPSRLGVKNGGAWLLAVVCLWLTIGATLRAEDEVTISPRSSFKIIQHYEGNFVSRIHFSKKAIPDVILGEPEPNLYAWPALFYISPDDKWVLQIQKTGSGDNTAFLFHVEPNGRVWRMEEPVYDLAYSYITQHSRANKTAMYHTGLEFGSWDLKAGFLRFSFNGTFDGGGGIKRKLAYDLKQHLITEP
jgi:hypothetical protein